MIKVSSLTILQDFLEISKDCVDHFKKSGLLNNSDEEEMVKFEAHILSFWLFQKRAIFSEIIYRLILDEIHNQYYKILKRNGYTNKLIDTICDNINLRYKTYNDTDLSDTEISLDFIKFLSKDVKDDNIGSKHITIPLYIINKTNKKINEFNNIIK
jgi:hypothetical protein